MEEKQNAALGTAPLGKLMVKFALPCTISLLVGALYNIVDQIFIGWGVGYLGNGATSGSGSLEVSGGYEYVDLEVTLRIMD